MADEHSTRVFKSGNSLALRLPKSIGFAEGDDVTLVHHEDGSLSLWRADESARVLDSLYGAFSPGFMSEGRSDAEGAERDWTAGTSRGRAA